MKSILRIKDPLELLYLSLMLRWERTAPVDKHQGVLDGQPERNTQMARMAYVLGKVWAGSAQDIFPVLERYARNEAGESYVSKNPSYMIDPRPLPDGWYFEGCLDLDRKQAILQHLTKAGVSPAFVACADDFVAGATVEEYLPTDEEQEEIIRRIRENEQHEP